MTATETSRQAYKELKESGRLGPQQARVLEVLQAMDYPPTINELSKGPLAGWQKSTISGRLNDLRDKEGLIHNPGKRADKYNGKKVLIWEPRIQ